MSRARRSIDVHGLAQGVGFRPFVHGLATRLGLGGRVYNAAGAVRIEVEGDERTIEEFVTELRLSPPPAARIRGIDSRADAPRGEREFQIVPSDLATVADVVVPADLATCDACVGELLDAHDRRFGHPFINCTQCGPRATVITSMPYDRERTTLTSFEMCDACRAEYEAPANRRFHAQPIACRACGPTYRLFDSQRAPMASDDPIIGFSDLVRRGGICALKGIGGFHLVCDATSDAAVLTLRRRKRRDAKPFAVMVRDLDAAEKLASLDDVARETLTSPARPIVLVPRRAEAEISRHVAPDVDTIGIVLPYAPVHHLVLAELDGRALVMTSGNRSSEPIATDDDEAFETLSDIADIFLTHDRPIAFRAEDSIVRMVSRSTIPVRRSRGHAPLPSTLPIALAVPTLAVGGHSKAVFALGEGHRAILGAHFGDLDVYRAYASFTRAIDGFEELFRMRPARIVRDLHDDYASSRYVDERVRRDPSLEVLTVQHHHAHMASCMVDNGLDGTVLGVCFDGMGLGTDGALWGGEFLVGGFAGFVRAGHLAYVRLPGGDRAARSPWRSALAHLEAAGCSAREAGLERHVDAREFERVEKCLRSSFEWPRTSSVGRLFDAVAALTGVLLEASHEGEAGQRLETLAARAGVETGTYACEFANADLLAVDTVPLIREVVSDVARGVSSEVIARRFHTAIVDLVEHTALRIRASYGVERVVLSGGVFVNAILAREVPERLERHGFRVFGHRDVPPNDGGLCLGQLAIAARRPRSAANASLPHRSA